MSAPRVSILSRCFDVMRCAYKSNASAHDGNAFPEARGRASGLGRVRGIEIDVVGDEEVEAPVAIVIDETAARGPADVVVPEAGFARDIGEGTVAVVVKQDIVSPESDEEIDEAIVVVVAGTDSLSPAGEGDAGLLGDVGEGAVMQIAVEMAGRLLSFRETFEAAAVDQEDVGPAVVVEVEGGSAAARRFENVALYLVASVFGFGGEAGLGGDVDEVDFGGKGPRRRGVWFSRHGDCK